MKRASVENVWVTIVGPTDWHIGPPGIDFSIDGGTTWVAASVDGTSAQVVRLRNGSNGTRCNVYVLSSSLAIPANTDSINVLVRIVTADEQAVVDAGSIAIE